MGCGAILLFCHSVFSDGIWKKKGYLCHLFLLFDEFSYLIFTLQFGGGLVAKSCPTLATPWTVARQAPLAMDFPGKNTGIGCHFLLQGSSRLRDQIQVSCIAGGFLTD